MTDKVKCGCGRSVSGFCDGSHALTNEDYKQKLEERLLQERKNSQKQLLTEDKV
ncbi:hypothetical protein UFOVP250_158 [uncultured Caudovirales phage]|uniref:Uncharacterized protein n=1 Tax=uncultured Caudovirales phage TaxID=2100421 RepID=A0A6J5LIL0_9CAUD|nr:hypothetical protein UFOVP250_158 [uncultured Caudovirales phage]